MFHLVWDYNTYSFLLNDSIVKMVEKSLLISQSVGNLLLVDLYICIFWKFQLKLVNLCVCWKKVTTDLAFISISYKKEGKQFVLSPNF